MEYENNNELKYTTLQIRSMLYLRNMNKKAKKRTRTQIPPGGMGNGLERAYSKIIFIKKENPPRTSFGPSGPQSRNQGGG